MSQNKILDIHCHLTRINPHFKTFDELKLRKDVVTFYKIWAKLIKVKWSKDINTLNQRLDAKLLKLTSASQIDNFAIFALDGVYDENGEIIHEKSVFYTSNEDVSRFCNSSPKLIPVYSINPLRNDALEQFEKAKKDKSAFIKWLPGLQKFDPIGPQALQLATECQKIGMPILIHLGQEFSFPGMALEKKYHRIDVLTTLLDTGCKIIVAHTGGFSFLREKKSLKKLEELVKQYPNLYFDNSGMLDPKRRSRLLCLRKSPVLQERVLFGTDYPCYSYTTPFVFNIPPKQMLSIMRTKNIFDRDYKTKKALGFSDETFSRAYKIIYK
jgi:predicted TIM-barrel fold metal-dependent hydrolase